MVQSRGLIQAEEEEEDEGVRERGRQKGTDEGGVKPGDRKKKRWMNGTRSDKGQIVDSEGALV